MRPFASITLVLLLAACSAQSAAPSDAPTGSLVEPQQIIPTETPVATATTEPTATQLPEPTLPDPAGYAWVQVAGGFARPLLLIHAGDGSGRLFVVEQGGSIYVVQNGETLAEPFLNIEERVGSDGNEQGLLGLAFHPDFETSGFFYVNYTDLNGDTVISRFSVSGDANVADANSEQTLLQVDQPFPNHNGGHLEFGPDGFLYAGLGDGGSQGDPRGNGQSLDTLLGKLLRIDVNSGSPYGIPADNPFGNEIWAYGFRNPWRFSFDRATGDLYIADVGQNQFEEIDFLPGGIAGGTNFGWNYFEGRQVYEGTPPEGIQLMEPVAEYEHGSTRCSVTGGYVYRGANLPAWQGVYVFADFCSGEIWGLVQHSGGNWEMQILYDTGFNATSFGLDEAGELYLVDRAGEIYQLQAQ